MRRIRLPSSVRFRTAAGGVLILSMTLMVAAVSFDLLLGREVQRAFDATLSSRADDRARLIDDGAAASSILSAVGDEEFVALLDPSGQVVASQGLAEPEQLSVPSSGVVFTQELAIFEYQGSEVETERVRVYAAPTSDGGAVVVGGEVDLGSSPRSGARRILLIGIPVLIAVAAAAAWRLAGRALAPVEALRSEVASIPAGSAGAKVAVPAAGDELTRLATTMNELLDRIDAHASQQRRFVADASHELKSPVANIRVLAETSAAPKDPKEWSELRGRMVAETERLAGLVDDLLFLARSDEAGAPQDPSVVHLDDLAFDEAERAQVHDVAVDAGSVSPADVLGDGAQLARVIRNLLDNAVRHASARVVITCGASAGHAELMVDDDGQGIEPADRRRVFERFTRLDSDRTRASGGTGLGLAIAERIVRDHDGSIEATSSPSGGARFVVRLPLAERD